MNANALEALRRQHHALLPPYLLRLPAATELASAISQQFLVQNILHDQLIRSYTAERGYERTFWRKIVSELERGVAAIYSDDANSVSLSTIVSRHPAEEKEAEVDERLYEHLANLMVSTPGSSDLSVTLSLTTVGLISGPVDPTEHSYTTLQLGPARPDRTE